MSELSSKSLGKPIRSSFLFMVVATLTLSSGGTPLVFNIGMGEPTITKIAQTGEINDSLLFCRAPIVQKHEIQGCRCVASGQHFR